MDSLEHLEHWIVLGRKVSSFLETSSTLELWYILAHHQGLFLQVNQESDRVFYCVFLGGKPIFRAVVDVETLALPVVKSVDDVSDEIIVCD